VSGGLMLAITGAATSRASVAGPSCGVGTVALTVTDDAGHTDTANVVITSSSVTTAAPSAAGQGSCSTSAPAVALGVCPASGSVQAGATETLTASLANTSDTEVSWQVNNIPGGNATIGTITSAGVYTAPATVPSQPTVTVTAVADADESVSASSQLTITSPPGGGGGGGGGGALDSATLLAGALWLGAHMLRRRIARSAGT